MDYLNEIFEDYKKRKEEQFHYIEKQIKEIHRRTVYRLIPEESSGTYRETQVVLRDSRTGEITFRPPPAVEVPYLMEDFIHWLNLKESREIHPVLRAGIAHYAIAAIHPFIEGNGRTARAFATLVLFVEEYDIRRLFSLEEYFDRDAETYYKTLIATSNQSSDLTERDLTSWLEYFTYGLSVELEKVREKVRKLSIDSRIRRKRGGQVMISERQVKIIEYLSENGQAVMRQLRQLFPDYSDDAILRDLQILTKKGIIKKKGSTKGAYYELVT
jgi:Fic family protein